MRIVTAILCTAALLPLVWSTFFSSPTLEPATVFMDSPVSSLEPLDLPVPAVLPRSTSPGPANKPVESGELDERLSAIAAAYRDKDAAAVEKNILTILASRPGIGDDLLVSLLEGELSPLGRVGALFALKTAVTFFLMEREEGLSAIRNPEAFVEKLVDGVVASHLTWSPIHDLAFTEGLIKGHHLDVIVAAMDEFEEEGGRPGSTTHRLLERVIGRVRAEDPLRLEALRDHPRLDVRSIVYDTILKGDPQRGWALNQELGDAPPAEGSLLFTSICKYADVEQIPFALVELENNPQERQIDYEQGLAAYLQRTDPRNYQEVVSLRGWESEADEYRRSAIRAISYVHHPEGISDALFQVLLRAYEQDPSAPVRGTALIGLANHWDPEDPGGFETMIDLVVDDPSLAEHVQTARESFLARSEGVEIAAINPDIAAEVEVAKDALRSGRRPQAR